MKIVSTSDLAAAIRQRRKDLGWSQAKLAEQTHVSRDWVIQLEKGKASAEIGLVLRVIKALGLILDSQPRKQVQPGGFDLDTYVDTHFQAVG